MGGSAGFRSLMVDYLPIDTKTGEITLSAASKIGVSQIKLLDPYEYNDGALMFTSADIGYEKVTNPAAKSTAKGAWTYVKGVDFGYGAPEFIAEVKGKGRIEVRLDDISSEAWLLSSLTAPITKEYVPMNLRSSTAEIIMFILYSRMRI